MIVSTKGRYALRVMIDLAEHQAEKYVPLKEVAARQEISEKYLENILKVLVQNGFLEGLRGKGGGYRLTRSPDQLVHQNSSLGGGLVHLPVACNDCLTLCLIHDVYLLYIYLLNKKGAVALQPPHPS